jgi:probable phosphoglycerate mutase
MPVLYYVRHGETELNAQARLQGRRDIGLNAHGRAQAAHCGDLLRALFTRDGRDADAFAYVASPLERARETMTILRTALGLAPEKFAVDDRLMEISYGAWEGMTLPEIEATMPGLVARRESDKWGFAPPDGESYRDLARRIDDWYDSLTGDTVVVAHGGSVRVLMARFGILSREEATRAQIAQGAVYVFADGAMTRYA